MINRIESSPAVTPDGTIVVGSNDDHVYFLGPDGTLKNKFKTRGNIRSSPLVLPDGTVVVGSGDGHVYFLEIPIDIVNYRFGISN